MGLMDKIKNLVNGNKDKVSGGVDKATDVADSKTGQKYTDKFDKVDDAAAKYAAGEDTPGPTS